MSFGNVVDELLDEHSLTDTSTTKEANLTTTSIWCKQIDDLYTCLKDFRCSGLLDERRRVVVDWEQLVPLDGPALVNGLTNDVHDSAKRALANRNLDGSASIDDLVSTNKTLRTVHSNGTDRVFSEVSGNLEDEATTLEILDFESVQNGREVLRLKLYVYDSTNDGFDMTSVGFGLRRVSAGLTNATRNSNDRGKVMEKGTEKF